MRTLLKQRHTERKRQICASERYDMILWIGREYKFFECRPNNKSLTWANKLESIKYVQIKVSVVFSLMRCMITVSGWYCCTYITTAWNNNRSTMFVSTVTPNKCGITLSKLASLGSSQLKWEDKWNWFLSKHGNLAHLTHSLSLSFFVATHTLGRGCLPFPLSVFQCLSCLLYFLPIFSTFLSSFVHIMTSFSFFHWNIELQLHGTKSNTSGKRIKYDEYKKENLNVIHKTTWSNNWNSLLWSLLVLRIFWLLLLSLSPFLPHNSHRHGCDGKIRTKLELLRLERMKHNTLTKSFPCWRVVENNKIIISI